MKLTTTVHYAAPVPEGIAALIAILREAGAVRFGSTGAQRVPIDRAGDVLELLEYADTIAFAGEAAGWRATLSTAPAWGVAIEWPEGDDDRATLARAIAALDQLATIGTIDFGTCHADPGDEPATIDEYRSLVLCREPDRSRYEGPTGLGLRTILGPRLVALLGGAAARFTQDPDVERRGDALVIGGAAFAFDADGPDRRRALADAVIATGVAARGTKVGGRFGVSVGPAFVRLPELDPLRTPSRESSEVVRLLQVSADNDTVSDLEETGVVAPFSALDQVQAEGLELEGAVLAFSDMSGSHIVDAGLIGADLRGVIARDVHWVEVVLVDADLRWADLGGAELPMCRADGGDWSHANLDGARGPESAERTCFDGISAVGWQGHLRAQYAGASFRGANLRGADLTGANLRGAIFDGADLTDARLCDADLTGASLRACTLTGADLTGANTNGASLPG